MTVVVIRTVDITVTTVSKRNHTSTLETTATDSEEGKVYGDWGAANGRASIELLFLGRNGSRTTHWSAEKGGNVL